MPGIIFICDASDLFSIVVGDAAGVVGTVFCCCGILILRRRGFINK